jgi:response regulator RpfG family c-di-GMP phosphodiesterase
MSDPVLLRDRVSAVPRTTPTPDQVPPTRVLVVDDEETIRLALSKFMRSRGFEVTAAGSGADALLRLRAEPFEVMLCDVRMPRMSGIEVVGAALEIDPQLAVIMLTAVNDAPTATEALARGAADYLIKPVELADLHQAVRRALHRREHQLEKQRVERRIREEVAQRTAELEREKLSLRNLTVGIAETLINAMEAKDVYLRGHSQRVAEFGALIAARLGLSSDLIEAVHLAGRLHDVGKIGIREEVLNKPARLTDEEFSHIKDHVRIGIEILAPLQHLGIVLEFVHDHHEHMDGSGYPRGRRSHEISIGGRILTAADAFDALTSKRAYRDPMTPEEALAHLGRDAGDFLDPEVYDALRYVIGQRLARSA